MHVRTCFVCLFLSFSILNKEITMKGAEVTIVNAQAGWPRVRETTTQKLETSAKDRQKVPDHTVPVASCKAINPNRRICIKCLPIDFDQSNCNN